MECFSSAEWQERCDWITNVFIHTQLSSKYRTGYWSMGNFNDLKTGLGNGLCGILHFLLRMEVKDKKLNHPFLLRTIGTTENLKLE